MAVSKVIYGGNTLIDISDSTITADNMLEGAIGYGANGERVTGVASAQSLYTKGRIVTFALSASAWVASDSGYTQQVSADVTESDYPFAQCGLSADYDTACDEMVQFQLVEIIRTYDGYIVAECPDDVPDIDITVNMFIVDGVTEATMSALHASQGMAQIIEFPVSGWVLDGEKYTQTVPANVTENQVVFADGIFLNEIEDAITEMRELVAVTDIQVSNGALTAVCYDGKAPSVYLRLFLKVFEDRGDA